MATFSCPITCVVCVNNASRIILQANNFRAFYELPVHVIKISIMLKLKIPAMENMNKSAINL